MSKQTKLTREQKNELNGMRASLNERGGTIYQNPEAGITVAVLPVFPGSEFSQVSVAYMGDGEKKFRRKVGQYIALNRLNDGLYITVPDDHALSFVEMLMAE